MLTTLPNQGVTRSAPRRTGASIREVRLIGRARASGGQSESDGATAGAVLERSGRSYRVTAVETGLEPGRYLHLRAIDPSPAAERAASITG